MNRKDKALAATDRCSLPRIHGPEPVAVEFSELIRGMPFRERVDSLAFMGSNQFPESPTNRRVRPTGRDQFGKWVATIGYRLSGPFLCPGFGHDLRL
jgi:hypothetical protein